VLPRAQDSYDTVWLIEVLTQLGAFYAGQQVVLLWDGLSAHWSHDMRAWLDTQARLRHGLGELYAYWAQNTAAVANILLDAQVLGHLGVGRRLLALQRDAPRCSPGAGRPQTSTSQRWRPRSGSRWTSTPGSAWSVSGACPSRQRSSLP